MKIFNTNSKMMTLSLDGSIVTLPIIESSLNYSLWVLTHKYKDVKLLNPTTSYSPVSITPPQLLDITDSVSIINYLGVDACLLLNNFNNYDEIVGLLSKGTAINTPSSTPRLVSQFDMFLVHTYLRLPKINGKPVLYNGVSVYSISSRSRKGFNKLVDRTREALNKKSNLVTIGNKKRMKKDLKLGKAKREYMESQLQEFFTLLHERLNIGT